MYTLTQAHPNAHAARQASAPTRSSPFTGTSPPQRPRSTSSKCARAHPNAHAARQASAPTRSSPFTGTSPPQRPRSTSSKCTRAHPNAHAARQASAPTRSSPFTGTSPPQRPRSTSSKCTRAHPNAHAARQANAPTRISPFTGTSPPQRPRSTSSKCTHAELFIYHSNSSHSFVKAPYQHSAPALNSNDCLMPPHLSRAVLKQSHMRFVKTHPLVHEQTLIPKLRVVVKSTFSRSSTPLSLETAFYTLTAAMNAPSQA
jgi:hypothetical protein